MTPDLEKEIKELEEFFRKLPKIAGVEYLNFFLDTFRKQGFTDKTFSKWAKRSRRDKNPKRRNLLVKTGRLKRSLRLSTKGNKVVIGTSTPYAQIHNEGGEISGNVGVRKHKRTQLVGRGRKRKKKTVTVRAHKRRVKIKIPQRQFLGQSAVMDEKLIKIIEERLIKIFK